MGRIPFLGLALLGFALQLHIIGAWNAEGHDRIGRIAEHLLVGKTHKAQWWQKSTKSSKDQIRTMMHSDLPDMSDYEQKTTKQYPDTSPLHWHRQDPEWTCDQRGGLGDKGGHVRCDGHGAENGSLFCALAFFFEHFAHDALLNEFPAPKEPIGTPDQLPALKSVPSNEQTPAHFLKWLVILLGDMHQPLHWLHEHEYGKSVMVRYKEKEYTLLDFWEDYLPNHLKNKLPTNLGQSGPFMIDKDFGQHSKAWAHKVPTELFREWAKEVAERVCGDVYHPMTVNHADGTRVDSPFTLTDAVFDKWVALAEELLQLAGERLGFVLNEIIEHKRHKDAHKDGRALPNKKVAVDVEKEESLPDATKIVEEAMKNKPSMPSMVHGDKNIGVWYKKLKIEEQRRSRNSALYNAFIAVILVPSLLFAFSWHERIGGGNLMIIKQKLSQA